ncbi:PAS domain S-box protein [Leptolyngbya sp. CCY15150]|uniref:PAS domain S-box protein n=1 Tax=Leptolyngbya sp. CCY15150 TaxID=2767772 RepID=UPI001951FCF2|nr:PAS domain S-box protein [Leptolyngbya sp. CCY15150]
MTYPLSSSVSAGDTVSSASCSSLAAQLQASDRTYRTLIDRMKEGVVIVDGDGIIQFVNQRYCQMLGYASADLIGRHESTLVIPEHRDNLAQRSALRQQGISDQYELQFKTRSGDTLWCLVSGSPFVDDDMGIHGSMGMLIDITERKQAELALQKSEAKQRALLEAIPDLILELDGNGTYLNIFVAPDFPFIGNLDNPVGKNLADQLPHDMAVERLHYIRQAIDTEQLQVYEYDTVGPQGVIHEEARVVKSGADEVLVIVRDMTERKRMESSLRDLTRLQQAILDHADFTILSTDTQGRIQTMNATAQRLLGYDAQALMGQATPLLFYCPAEVRRRAIALSVALEQPVVTNFEVLVTPLAANDPKEQDWTYISRTGDRIPMAVSATALHNPQGDCTGYLLIGRNMSVQRCLDGERRKLASVVENSSELVGILSLHGPLEFLNRAGQQLLGLESGAIAHVQLADLIHPQDQVVLSSCMVPMLQAEGAWHGEINLRHAITQATIPVLLNAFWLDHTDSNVSPQVAIVAQDITELKQVASALSSAQTQFRRLFANVPGMIFQYIRHGDGQQSFPFIGYQCIRIFGLDRYVFQSNPSLFWSMVHPDDHERVAQALDYSQTSQLPIQQEWRMVLPTGQICWVQGIARPERQDNGDMLWDGILLDISDRKRLEEERNQFFNLSPDIMAIVDFKGRFLSVNPAIVNVLGYSPDTIQGQLGCTFVHPDDEAALQALLSRITSGSATYSQVDNRYRHQDGSYRWLSWRTVAVPEKQLIYAIAHDVTEKKQVEQALLRSRNELEQRVAERTVELHEAYQRLSSLIENSPIGVIEWNSHFQVQGWSPRTSEIFGWKFGEVVDKHPNDWPFIYEDDIDQVNHVMQDLLSGYQPHNVCHNRNLTKTGEVIYCEWYNSTLFDDSGQLISMLSLVLDVTERRQAEQELRASQERFAMAFNASPIPLSITSYPDSRHIAVNEAWIANTGFSREEAIGRTSEDMQFWNSSQERQAFLETMQAKGHVQNMLIHSQVQGGDVQTMLLSSGRIELGGQPCLLSACLDISDRIRAEKALRTSKEFSENLIANLQDGFSLLDHRGVHLDVNPALCDMTGFSRDELIGTAMPHPYWPPEEQATIMTAAQTLANGQELDDVELIFMRKNGQRFPVIVTPTILYDEQGTITNYMALIKDISHIKLVQEELRRSRDELELRVQQRTMELADVNAYLQTQIMERENLTQQLLHSNQELEQFAYIASHDLQEPLRAITSYTQLLAQRYEEQLDERADKYIHYIVDGASYMQQLIQDLLSYSRVGRGELTLEQLDLNQVLQQVEKNLDAAIAEAEARLHYDPLPTITADLNQLTRLLQNLVSNAIKYRSDRSPEITITVEDLGDYWLFTLQDNGIGIDPQYADRIFIIFQRLHTRRQYSGTGIGLAICKKIVERHHGTIGVQSQPGQGSTFRFTIAKALTQQAFLEE